MVGDASPEIDRQAGEHRALARRRDRHLDAGHFDAQRPEQTDGDRRRSARSIAHLGDRTFATKGGAEITLWGSA